jgi:gluconate 2-dehydrogenase gamma chain
MNRRSFLSVCSIEGTSLLFASSKQNTNILSNEQFLTIQTVQQHMFPDNNLIPSAKTFRATKFLIETISHHTFDRDIRKIVIDGATELQNRENNKFLTYNSHKIEKALRSYEESSYGSNWLNQIMILSLEALMSDPIYGGNYNQLGWDSLKTKGGTPRPKKRYIEL